jgi:DNA-binding IclR family transcriptional regulator
MRNELDRICARGYAIENEEYETGVGCIGVPVLNDNQHATAAISVSAPLARLQQLDIPKLATFMAGHTREMSQELGYEDPIPAVGSAAQRDCPGS